MGDKAADSTAGGPLFQQRPYPAPGSVLKRKQDIIDDHSKKLRTMDGPAPPPDHGGD
jgi:hypothetical protein